MKTIHATHQKGYTLIELLLYIAILSALLGSITAFFGTVYSARVKNQSITEVDQQGTFAMDYIARTIRNATGITSPTAGNSANSLTITVPTSTLSPTIFSLDGGTTGAMQVKEGAAAYVPLTNSNVVLSSLSFTNLTRSGTPGTVRISFVVSRVNNPGRNEYDYQKTFVTSAALR